MFLDLSYSSNAMFIFVFHARQELNILASTADNILKEYYLHSPYQTLREASYYLNLHFFPLFNFSYDVGRSMMIKGMQLVHVQCNILIYTTSLKFDVSQLCCQTYFYTN